MPSPYGRRSLEGEPLRGSNFYSLLNLDKDDDVQHVLFQLGVALGFVIPSAVVSDQSEADKYHLIGEQLFMMFLVVAIITTVLLLAVIVCKC